MTERGRRAKFPMNSTRTASSRSERSKAWYKAHPEIRKEVQLNADMKKLYGITAGRYREMEEYQDALCAICFTDIPGGHGKRLAVDHNHDTKQVRGLLCSNCNRGLGLFQDNPALLREAAEYLEAAEIRGKQKNQEHHSAQ